MLGWFLGMSYIIKKRNNTLIGLESDPISWSLNE